MNNKVETKIGTYEKIRLFFISFFAQLNVVTVFAAYKTEYETKLSALITRSGKAGEVITGGTVDKRNARSILSMQMRKLAGMIVMYAFNIDDNLLLEKFRYPKSTLDRMRDSELFSFSTTHQTYAASLTAELTALGYTAADMTAFITALNNYHTLLQLPRNKQGERSHALSDSDTLMQELDDLLDFKMDGIVLYVEASNPGIMIEYMIARSIDNTSGTSTTPDYQGTITPATINEIAELQFEETRSFKVKVKTANPAVVGLSSNTTNFEGTPLTIPGNSSFIVSSANLGAPGMNHLLLQNPDATTALEYAITLID